MNMQQLSMLSDWIEPSEKMPEPGQRVVAYYRDDDGSVVGPIIGTPIHTNGSHILGGESIYKPTVAWMPIPDLPKHLRQEAK